ncbi:exo-beta-N-acetylmuramidase NamZ domain-containing protein [Trinickia caryophylli]|uniref:Uncharacterized conserved protein YbbC, DUF1343 family n=1 Tax=Trinickia caryophylli TaxID=28094 RepID=A0A1X7D0T3_TRICW|nr:exo-beta-N-acetylmuramidase NamZ domain-containing protein [Trinickia caryophylli]PMS13633.1 DUF1343 domain-containing protein [Trinickia caryophylli]TRX15277.1 DUF1343 domain-containing protein [Trinickia caryophylli]WQE15153.1 DUF1343 domain-containing protein [Trinickia caryophylli]SMF06572.1 Uncharacterized conserved protein YbbC, DUF1343 family [Trinickia caryophylli]GLU31108.1 hypothetical protein Busp01_09500 [Trinickia caryophylli]
MESSKSLRERAASALSEAVGRSFVHLRARLLALPVALTVALVPLSAVAADIPDAAREELNTIVEHEIAAQRIPGAVVAIGDASGVFYRAAFGERATTPRHEPMTIDTVFDLASLTKAICTTTAVMQLVETHRLRLDDPVARYWPAFAANGKGTVTVGQLLAHTSGLAPDVPLAARNRSRPGVLREVLAERLHAAPGARVIYSDINFVVLGELVQRITHRTLDDYARAHIFAPLAMRDTQFVPDLGHMARSAPTTPDGAGMREGRVHDPTAAAMGGVAGNAGLFSTADDLARYARMLLGGGRLEGARVLRSSTVASLTVPRSPPGELPWRGFGWALDAPLVPNRDRLAPLGALTHTGYTGTALWIDFVTQRFVIILSNRVHPYESGDARPLRAQIVGWLASRGKETGSDDIARALPLAAPAIDAFRRPPSSHGPVLSGIDVLQAQAFAPLAGMRVGLLTNRSGFDHAGRRTIDLLAQAPGLTLVTLFSPEHGLATDRDARVPDARDAATGLPVRSLYGGTRRFAPASLDGLDALVVDLQDAGVRLFTYETTLGYALEAAAARGIPLFVLDRPNPLGADTFGGPVLDADRESFTGYHPLPLVHGMTMGELATLLNDERGIGAQLHVIPMQGYRRAMRFADTGLGWVPPSPNLRTLAALDLYPDLALLEGANLSVGRGTARPFEQIGAPWMDGEALAQALNARALGARFRPVDFVPLESTYRGKLCHGVAIARDMASAPSGMLGLGIAIALRQLYPDRFDLDATRDAIGSTTVWEALRNGASLETLQPVLDAQRASFAARRSRFLLY